MPLPAFEDHPYASMSHMPPKGGNEYIKLTHIEVGTGFGGRSSLLKAAPGPIWTFIVVGQEAKGSATGHTPGIVHSFGSERDTDTAYRRLLTRNVCGAHVSS